MRKEADPEQLDTEYQAFLADMGIKGEEKATEKPYVPPMGDLSKCFQPRQVPLMLTNGSSAPGMYIFGILGNYRNPWNI